MPAFAASLAPLASLLSAAVIATLAPASVHADELADLVNAYRAAPGSCAGRPAAPAAPLATVAALSAIWVGPGTFLAAELDQAGFSADRVDTISVSGPPDAGAAMDAIRDKYCATLLSAAYSSVGTARRGDAWQVVLAHRLDIPELPGQAPAGQQILALVNAARARPRDCGAEHFGAAGALRWNGALAQAALAHSVELAGHHYFSHTERDGSQPGDRVARAGYAWSRIGENIASGQRTAPEAVQSWLDSPGHCANIMNPGFTEMGAAYAIDPQNRNRTPYWTQEFARPR